MNLTKAEEKVAEKIWLPLTSGWLELVWAIPDRFVGGKKLEDPLLTRSTFNKNEIIS